MVVRLKTSLAVTALIAGLVGPAPAWAWTAPGCTNLPKYERALGALQGMTSACNMSIEKANRVVAAQGNRPGGLFGALLNSPPGPVVDVVPVSRPSQSRVSPLHRHRVNLDPNHHRESVVR